MIYNLKPYPKYKDSGVPWLGQIPEHWEIQSLGSMITARSHRSRPDLPLLSVVREKGVIPRLSMGKDENHNFVPDDLGNYKLVHEGDLVINKMKAWQGSLGISPQDGIVSPAYYVFKFQISNRRFGHMLLRSKPYVSFFGQVSDGVRIGQWDLSIRGMKRIPIIIPLLAEQFAIVKHLNYIDQRIQRYIRAKQRLIKLLEEQKQIIIHQAVTQGLDQNVKLKPSGIEWIGDIPGHWEIKPAKWFFREIDERSSTGSEELLSVSHITGVTPRSEKNITMFMAESYLGYKLCRENDLVINTMWAWMAALGVAQQSGIVSYSYGVYRPIHKEAFLSQYIDLLLRTKPYVTEYICRSTGIHSSRLRLYPEQFLRIPIIQPPIEEQQAILDEIHNKTSKLQLGINTSNQEISLLREYRTRLISDVVTGKLDVREVVSNMIDKIECPETYGLDEDFCNSESFETEFLEEEASEY